MQKQLQDCINCSLVMRTIKFTCASSLVGMASSVSEILLILKMTNFPFWTMDYSP